MSFLRIARRRSDAGATCSKRDFPGPWLDWVQLQDLFEWKTLMPKLKILKGVAHNIGSSFTSLMNYSGDDYSMGHILRFARESGINSLTIDLLTGQGSPASLLKEPISALPSWYSKMFLRLRH